MRTKLLSVVFVIFLVYSLVSSEPNEEPEDPGVLPESYMQVRIIEGPNTTDDETVTKRGVQEQTQVQEQVQVQDQKCRWNVHELHNEGSVLLCQCLKCVCRKTRWLCDYHFKQCPFFHCGQNIFSPITQKCCCGDIYAIKKNWGCCGYKYYNTKVQKCCAYSSLKQKEQTCPRSSV